MTDEIEILSETSKLLNNNYNFMEMGLELSLSEKKFDLDLLFEVMMKNQKQIFEYIEELYKIKINPNQLEPTCNPTAETDL